MPNRFTRRLLNAWHHRIRLSVILHALDAGYVLRRHTNCFDNFYRMEDAPQMHDSVCDDNIASREAPLTAREFAHQHGADLAVREHHIR